MEPPAGAPPRCSFPRDSAADYSGNATLQGNCFFNSLKAALASRMPLPKAVVQRFLTAGSQVSYLDGPSFARFLEGDTERLVKLVRKIGLS